MVGTLSILQDLNIFSFWYGDTNAHILLFWDIFILKVFSFVHIHYKLPKLTQYWIFNNYGSILLITIYVKIKENPLPNRPVMFSKSLQSDTVLLGIYQILACQIWQPKLWCGGQAILYLQDVSSNLLYKNLGFEELPILNIDGKPYNPTNTPRGFHVEMMWERSFPRCFNAESTRCVCRELTFFHL